MLTLLNLCLLLPIICIFNEIYKFLKRKERLSVKDKAILITGCDSGIGYYIAKKLYQNGFILICGFLTKESDGYKYFENIAFLSEKICLIQLDITKEESVKNAVIEVEKFLDKHNLNFLHGLINNAGVCMFGEFDWLNDEQWQRLINVNLIGTIRMCKSFLHLLLRKYQLLNKREYDHTRIVNVCSVNSFCAYPGIAAYCASKFGMKGFSDSLRLEINKLNVKVINIYPGDFCRLTNIFNQRKNEIERMKNSLSNEKEKFYSKYFDEFHEHVDRNYGLVGAKSFDETNLYSDFEEALLSPLPRHNMISGNFLSATFLPFLSILPIDWVQAILDTLFKYGFKLDAEKLLFSR